MNREATGALLIMFVVGLVLVNPDIDPALAVVLLAGLLLVTWILSPQITAHEKRRSK